MSPQPVLAPSAAELRTQVDTAETAARVARADLEQLHTHERAAAVKGADALAEHRTKVDAQRREADRLDHMVGHLHERLEKAETAERDQMLDELAARLPAARATLDAARATRNAAHDALGGFEHAIRMAEYDLAAIESPLRAAGRLT